MLQLNNLGWSTILVHIIVRDLRDKKGVAPLFRLIGWTLFRKSCVLQFAGEAYDLILGTVGTVSLPFILRVGRSNPKARLLSFFLGFGACFVWLAIAVEGLFYVVYSLTLVLWVEVESELRSHTRRVSETPTTTQNASTYRPQADDLRIAVFFLFFVQVAFFGTGK